jgi:Zincin-like metallopeptidase
MRTADFDQIVEQAFHRIPVRFRRHMRNVAVIVEDEPSPLQLQRGNASYTSTLLGLYEGRPLAYRSVREGFQLPDRITLRPPDIAGSSISNSGSDPITRRKRLALCQRRPQPLPHRPRAETRRHRPMDGTRHERLLRHPDHLQNSRTSGLITSSPGPQRTSAIFLSNNLGGANGLTQKS